MRQVAMKFANRRGHNAQRGGRQRANAHHVTVHALFMVQRLSGGIQRVQHPYRMGQELFADDGQVRTHPAAIEQPRAG